MHSKSSPPAATEVRNEQIERAAIVGQLAGGVLHDFNNILTVITGTIEILAAAVADRPELVAIANLIDQAATRGARLTSHLVAFARGQPSLPRAVDVNSIIEESSRLLRATLGVEIEIVQRLADDLPPALADPDQLTAAILSLAILTRDSLPGGGKLVFRTAVCGEPGIAAVPPAGEQRDAVLIAVHACGLRSLGEPRGRIFDDTGMIEKFVSRCGGHIAFDDQTRDGALAEIFLPNA